MLCMMIIDAITVSQRSQLLVIFLKVEALQQTARQRMQRTKEAQIQRLEI